jgi:integrase
LPSSPGLLGHASIAMTADKYGHLFPPNDDRAALDAAAEWFFN